ncbi:MAG TPA: DUF748 domain-containing protein [Rhodocyclaceae bacterium]|nr:DUF748 domain-containing protein [Rhodocyclaceae bacterium]
MSQSSSSSLLQHRHVQKAVSLVQRHRRWLYAFVAIFVVFGLLGFFWLPGFAKSKIETLLSEQLHRPVTVQHISINPYALSATVEGFRIGEKAGDGALFKFDSLYVNVSSASIVRMAPVISAVKLVGPEVHLTRDADGQLSIVDLIEKFSKPETEKPSSGPARFAVSNIEIEKGSFDFDDQLKKSHQHVGNIALGLPFIASFASDDDVWVQPHFSATLNGKAPINLQGKALPFSDHREASLNVKLSDFDLTGVDEYAPDLKGLKLLSGLLDTDLNVTFSQIDGKPAALSVTGDVVLRKLGVDNKKGLPWQVNGERLALHLKQFDPMLKQPIDAGFDLANLRFKQGDKPELLVNTLDLSDAHVDMATHKASFKLDATTNGRGHLALSGSAGWAPVSADVTVNADQIDLVALQGFVFDAPSVIATKGALSFKGAIKAIPGDDKTAFNVAVTGDAGITDLYVLDKGTHDQLLGWSRVDVSGIDVKTAPLDVGVQSIAATDLFARVTVTPEGKLRLKDVLSERSGTQGDSAGNADSAKSATPTVEAGDQGNDNQASGKETKKTTGGGTVTTAPAPVTPERKSLPIRIGEVSTKNGNIIYNDLFIKPNYRANLTQLNGKIGPLVPGKPGMISIKGSINRAAPLTITGKVDPFGKELYLDMSASAKGIDMPGFSPYSGRYIGYAIDKGKLSVDVHYFIEKNELRAENHIFLDQFTLGQKVDSPNALSVPIGLAISLLKNSRGEIDINLPLSGSLNDPQFSIGSLIITVIKNLIVKAATAPFTLLGSLFGGGADLSHVDFAPGYARITPEADKALDTIAKAMADRPSMKTEVTGVADSVNDVPDLKQATMQRLVKAQKLDELAKEGKSGGSLADVTVSDAEYPKYLERAYKAAKFDKPRNLIGMTKSLPVPEMEKLMLANMPADEEALRALADRRAHAVAAALIDKGVPTERVFVVQSKVEAPPNAEKPAGRVDFSLR